MFERDMATNYPGTLRMCQAFAPVIEAKGGGAIVNRLTIVALAPKPGVGGYSASKAAAFSMTQGLRVQLADRPIAVHAAYPARVDTDMLAGVDVKIADLGDVVAAILDGVQAGQLDIAPDPESAEGFRTWFSDPKALEAMFAPA